MCQKILLKIHNTYPGSMRICFPSLAISRTSVEQTRVSEPDSLSKELI